MGDVAALVSAAGGFGVLALVIGYLVNANRADRVDYREALAQVRRELDDAEQARDGLQERLDEERAARRRAEDESARAVRAAEAAAAEMAQLRNTIASLEEEVRRLRRIISRAGAAQADGAGND